MANLPIATPASRPSSSRSIDDELQLASAWLPGRIAQAHVRVIANHLIKAVASLAKTCGLVSDAAAELTSQLGDTRLQPVFCSGGGNVTSLIRPGRSLTFEDTFDKRFLRGAKLNVASVCLARQEQWFERRASGLQPFFNVMWWKANDSQVCHCASVRTSVIFFQRTLKVQNISANGVVELQMPNSYMTTCTWMWDETDWILDSRK